MTQSGHSPHRLEATPRVRTLMRLSQTPIRLYSYPTSPYAQKVGCYLKYKKLDFELVGVNPITSAEIRFTGQKRVPVLKIGDEWRLESSELGLWLDELYPEIPIMPADKTARGEVLAIDQWVSESLIPTIFRRAIEWENPIYSIENGWKLARAVPVAMVCASALAPRRQTSAVYLAYGRRAGSDRIDRRQNYSDAKGICQAPG